MSAWMPPSAGWGGFCGRREKSKERKEEEKTLLNCCGRFLQGGELRAEREQRPKSDFAKSLKESKSDGREEINDNYTRWIRMEAFK